MKVRLYSDDTIKLRLDEIVANLNRLAPNFRFSIGQSEFSVPDDVVMYPETYNKLNPEIGKESSTDDEAILFTEIPYDNNFFFECLEETVIVSLSGWGNLTNLSKNNGAVYLVCSILIDDLGVGFTHEKKNTGCINDFWSDKTGVDAGMRCAFVCERCIESSEQRLSKKDKKLLGEIQAILNDLCGASRANMDICDFWSLQNQDESFDVFMCHNSKEKDVIREMNQRLKKSGVVTWLDEEQLPPGRLWQELLEEQIATIKTAAVFVGDSGIGPWQDMEIRSFLNEFVRRKCPVIPVILPGCKTVPKLPLFLSQLMWVDFRKSKPEPYNNLLWGITGKKP